MPTIRPATLTDLPKIRSINTHYILNTVLTFAQDPPPASTYAAKYQSIKERGLPYFVAVDEVTKNEEDGHDVVLGYAYLSPFRGHLVSYASTVELSLFVHPGHQSRSLGSRLLDVVIEAAERARYVAFEVAGAGTGTEEEGERGEKVYVEGEGAPLRNILAIMAVNPEGLDDGDALRRWYIKRGFVEGGEWRRLGTRGDFGEIFWFGFGISWRMLKY